MSFFSASSASASSAATSSALIDKLVFTGKIDGYKKGDGWYKVLGNIRNLKRLGFSRGYRSFYEGNKPRWHFELVDRIVREGYASSKSLYRYYIVLDDGSFINFSPYFRTIRPFRIEFNPAKCKVDTIKFIKEFLLRIRVNRVDICIDFDNVDLNKYFVIDRKGVKKQYILGRDSKIETIYLGGRKSERKVRIYDKRKELLKGGVDIGMERMRVEVQRNIKGGSNVVEEIINDKMFDGFYILKKEGDIERRALIHYLASYPWEVGELSKYKRKRLNCEVETEILDVVDCFKSVKMKLREQLLYYIKNSVYVHVIESFDGENYIQDREVYRRTDKVEKVDEDEQIGIFV